VHYANLSKHYDKFVGSEYGFENCRSVFKAAREDYDGGYLFSVRALVKAEVLSDAFEQARELLENGYKDPACVLRRVALEVTLKELCDKKGIVHGKSLEHMNTELCKAGVYNMAKQKQITAWAEIGNKAAHGQWDQYTENDAKAMLDGVQALVADIL
jgi:HEPN domain-containing protein